MLTKLLMLHTLIAGSQLDENVLDLQILSDNGNFVKLFRHSFVILRLVKKVAVD